MRPNILDKYNKIGAQAFPEAVKSLQLAGYTEVSPAVWEFGSVIVHVHHDIRAASIYPKGYQYRRYTYRYKDLHNLKIAIFSAVGVPYPEDPEPTAVFIEPGSLAEQSFNSAKEILFREGFHPLTPTQWALGNVLILLQPDLFRATVFLDGSASKKIYQYHKGKNLQYAVSKIARNAHNAVR